MAQFDLYQNSDPATSNFIPYLLDVQHQLHQSLVTRMVVPLIRSQMLQQELKKLCPCFSIQGEQLVMSTPEMAGYPVRDLGPAAGTLVDKRIDILTAIDFLLSGF